MNFDQRFEHSEFSNFLSPSAKLYAVPMFETIVAEIATAADKLTHLRRFL